jgi:hypothetical protein
MLERAKEFAERKFKNVGLKNHYLEVVDILQNEFDVQDENILTSAVLHDKLEDTDTIYEEIETEFSKEVADYVQEVSHPKNYGGEEKDLYYENLKYISPGAKMIKLADFTSHLRKFIGAFTGTSDYPKMTHNEYVLKIKSFLESCEESNAKSLVLELANELDRLIRE